MRGGGGSRGPVGIARLRGCAVVRERLFVL